VKAVSAFQKASGLPVTGKADYETQQRLLEG
jgi:peptidoglycan hydrolase-like protein with peptidoglycan-binding domain